MKWPIIALLVMTGLLWITIFMLLVIWILLRAGKIFDELFSYLDAPGLARAQKRSLWFLLPLGAMLAAGVVLIVFDNALFWSFFGALLVSASISGAAALLLLAEVCGRAGAKPGEK
ncbi:hypothetical protein ES703_16324 [subsurface metagenome]|nr:hypothetical protein [bacterium]